MRDVNAEWELKRFGDLEEGDILQGPNGEELSISTAYDPHIPEKMYEITMDSGAVGRFSANHLWYVETEFDISMHRQRQKEAKKALKKMDQQYVNFLLQVLEQERRVETSLWDIICACGADDSESSVAVFTRVAESLGPISEDNSLGVDVATGDSRRGDSVMNFDAKRFAEQILRLSGKREYRKIPLVVGRVVTTEEMLQLNETMDVFLPDSPK